MGMKLSDLVFLVGGIIPDEDAKILKEMGVDEIFGPGTTIKKISDFIRQNVSPK
jgi:methylmalonyl-CoA mutase C-terminal domain/subunit